MKRLSIAINLPDNGGITFFGPLQSQMSKSPTHHPSNQRMYLCPSHDPAEVGKALMAMLADLQMSGQQIPSAELDKELADIQF